MKFYVNLIVDKDDKTTKAIYEYDTVDECLASFHKNLGNNINGVGVNHVLAIAFNSEGGIYENTTWNKPETEVDENE